MDLYKSADGIVDIGFFQDMARESGKLPAALKEMPKLPCEYQYIVMARSELYTGQLITYAEMQAYLADYPEIEPTRFKQLLRALDRAFAVG